MADCKKYRIQISELIDGELSSGKTAGLEAHLASCASCRRMHDAFVEISCSMPKETAAVPANLAESVMGSIDVVKLEHKKKKPQVWGYLAAAACFALVMFGALQAGFFTQTKNTGAASPELAGRSATAPDDAYVGGIDFNLELDALDGYNITPPVQAPAGGADGGETEESESGAVLFSEETALLNSAFTSNLDFANSELDRLRAAQSVSIYEGALLSDSGKYENLTPIAEDIGGEERDSLFVFAAADIFLAHDDTLLELAPFCIISFSDVKSEDVQTPEVIEVIVWIYNDQLIFMLDGEEPILFLSKSFPVDFEDFIQTLAQK